MFIKTNNEVSYTSSDVEATEELPAGNWLLKFSEIKGYYLESTPEFKFPDKIYGNPEKLSGRYLNTFNKVDGNVGVLLTGSKGTGKSVTAKLTAHNSKLPVIIITEPFHDENFKSFLSNITQKSVIFVDEFEKVYYNYELQNSFLSILDGVFEGKKLFLFTSNEKGKVNTYMLNRLGRIHYLEEYDSLSDSIVDDVIEDNLIIKENKEELVCTLGILGTVSMDILINLLREMNMYEETAKEAVSYLNLKPESSLYVVEIYQGSNRLGEEVIHNHPLSTETFTIEFLCKDISMYEYTEEELVEMDESIELNAVRNRPIEKSRWLYLDINIVESKVINKGKKIIIEADNNMRYICTKKDSYTFTF